MGIVTVDGNAMRYVVRRTPAGKYVHLRLKPNLELEISIPATSEVDVRTILRRKRDWIKRKYQETASTMKLFKGNRVLYKGAYHRLKTIRSAKRAIKVRTGLIILPIRSAMQKREALKQWMKLETEKLVKRRLASYRKKYGFSFKGFSVQETRKWAYCTENSHLVFTWQLIGLPADLANYVILHEATHLKEFNHSKRFRYNLSSIVPDFKEKERMLRRFVAE